MKVEYLKSKEEPKHGNRKEEKKQQENIHPAWLALFQDCHKKET